MSDAEFLRTTTEYLHTQIPLTRAMGVQVVHRDDQQLILTAPLEPNHNHLGTAFGGSLGALATLAGYALLWLDLGNRQAHVVIRESSLKFHRPVQGELRAVCRAPDAATRAEFRDSFERKGKARLVLLVEILEEGAVAVEFTGTFVAVR